jgi:hypothetical protein
MASTRLLSASTWARKSTDPVRLACAQDLPEEDAAQALALPVTLDDEGYLGGVLLVGLIPCHTDQLGPPVKSTFRHQPHLPTVVQKHWILERANAAHVRSLRGPATTEIANRHGNPALTAISSGYLLRNSRTSAGIRRTRVRRTFNPSLWARSGLTITRRAPWRAVTKTRSASRERTYHARSPGRKSRLTARPTQPLIGRQEERIGRIRRPRHRNVSDSTAAWLANADPRTELNPPHSPIQATAASTQRKHHMREIQRATESGTVLISVVMIAQLYCLSPCTDTSAGRR